MRPEPDTTHVNVAVVRGVLSSAPRTRELPSGASLTQLDITTRTALGTTSVPVVVPAADAVVAALAAGDEIVVVGRVARRYFRAGGATQSRTELVAERVARAGRRQAVDRALKLACGLLDAARVGVG